MLDIMMSYEEQEKLRLQHKLIILKKVKGFIFSNSQSLKDYCKEKGILLSDFRNGANLLINDYPEVYKMYTDKLNNIEYKNELQKSLKPIEAKKDKHLDAINLLKDLIMDDQKINNEFAKNKGITKDYLGRNLCYLKTTSPKIYDVYYQFLNNSYANNHEDLKKTAEIILSYLREGYEVNGKKRPFNILDYCLSTSISIQDIENYLNTQKLNMNDKKSFLELKRKMITIMARTNPDFFKKEIFSSVIKDGSGNLKVTNEEKEQIFNFLSLNGLTAFFYPYAMDAYKNNEIELNKKYAKKIPNSYVDYRNKKNSLLVCKIDILAKKDSYLKELNNEIEEVNQDFQKNKINR